MNDSRNDETIGGFKTVANHHAAEPLPHPAEPATIDGMPTMEKWSIEDDKRFHSRRWRPGEEICSRYVVEKELGQGGMGVVYGCFDKVGGVRVAVKALPPELSHNSVEMEEVRENFALVDELRHPNIAGVRTLEKDARGEYFLVMDVAEGENLRKWIRRKRKAGGVSLAEAVGVLRQVAAALDYAHGERIVHRDVKPGNVVIDAKGRVKVLDFGLAAQIRTSLSRASQAYRGTSGTGPYMAPEQWEAQPQDEKTDQYALGVMAYEMLSGRLPFENAELAVLKDAVLHGEVRTVPGLPGAAMAALRRALAKKPETRWGNCAAFVAALEKGGEAPAPPVPQKPAFLSSVPPGPQGRRIPSDAEKRAVQAAEEYRARAEEYRRREMLRQSAEERQRKQQGRQTGKVLAVLVAAGLLAWGGQSVWFRRQTSASGSAGTPRPTNASASNSAEFGTHAVVGDVMAIDLGNGVKLEMVSCPGVGRDFWMGKYEITQEQWQRVTGKTPSHFGGKPKNPVECVSWNDCQDFVKALNALPAARASGLTFRLPTEEEWETACRAGAPKSADYCKLADGTQITEDTLRRVARYDKAWGDGPTRVGSLEPNAWGLYDMHGNVWEWTQTAVGGLRVYRGGSFNDSAGYCTAGYRCRLTPVLAHWHVGLRLAASGRAATR